MSKHFNPWNLKNGEDRTIVDTYEPRSIKELKHEYE